MEVNEKKEIANVPKVNILQINLNRSGVAQDLAIQTARERGVDVIIVSEQNRGIPDAMWHEDQRGDAAVYVCNKEFYRVKKLISGKGYVGVSIGQLGIFSCYFSPNAPSAAVELDIAALE